MDLTIFRNNQVRFECKFKCFISREFDSIDRTIFNNNRDLFECKFKRLVSHEFDLIDRTIFNDDRIDIAKQDKRTWRGCDSCPSYVAMKTGQADTGRCGISCRSWYWRRYSVTSVMETVPMLHKSVGHGTVHFHRQFFGVPSQSSSTVICVVTSLWREN